MKRKFYLLALVCAVAGSSVISSCKDTDEDLYNDLKNQLSQSNENYNKLQDQLKTIKDQLEEKLKEKGPQGDKGDKGDKGDQGTAGKSAYEVAKDNGFEGTEAEWLESLRGPKGDDAAIDAALEAVEALRKDHNADINELKELITKLEKVMSTLDVAGVIIQNVYNTAYGEFALPLGINSNALIGYYSIVNNSDTLPCDKFPTTLGSDPTNGLDATELAGLGFTAKGYDLTEAAINLGKVYVTVNPTNTDFAGKTPLLVNSKGEKDGITLSALETSDELLSFGYTRANTGLYVTSAKVTDLGAADKLNLNVEKNAKELRDAFKAHDKAEVIRVVYDMIQNMNLKRKGIQLKNTNSTVVSALDLAAVLVKPLGFETLEKVCGSSFMSKLKEVTAPTTGKATVDKVLAAAQNTLENLYDASLPAIVVEENANKHYLLSVDKSNPTPVPASMKLYAASYSAEILVPYIMKHVAVVNVEGAADNAKAKANANNAIHMNCILSNDECHNLTIDLAALESGATYELVYSAMDYAGKAVAQRFYFKVK